MKYQKIKAELKALLLEMGFTIGGKDNVFYTTSKGPLKVLYRVELCDRKVKWSANTNGRWYELESPFYSKVPNSLIRYRNIIEARLQR